MAEKETLWLAAARFDSEREDLDALAAAGFIGFSERGGKFAFSHQTVFEHILARSFLTKAGGLGTFISRGISQTDIRQLLTGALAVSLLAILADFALIAASRAMTSPGLRSR